jgi:hypothetical protein
MNNVRCFSLGLRDPLKTGVEQPSGSKQMEHSGSGLPHDGHDDTYAQQTIN